MINDRGEGPGDSGVAVLGREVSVLRGPQDPVLGILPGRYEMDDLRRHLGNRLFADLVSIGDIRLETGG
jgi:hypothetical protein